MPQDNKDAYKEMYEMGQRLMTMATDGGYDPESEDGSYEDSPMEATPESGMGSTNKVNAALKLFGNG